MFSSPSASPAIPSSALSALAILLPGRVICVGEALAAFFSVRVVHGQKFCPAKVRNATQLF